jgi:hypothetical protein
MQQAGDAHFATVLVNQPRVREGTGMHCRRCPHLVRHGQLAEDQKTIEFKNLCGLMVKQQVLEEQGQDAGAARKNPRKGPKKPPKKVQPGAEQECKHFPFPEIFDYIECTTYQGTFKSASRKNDVIPTKDFQYSDALSGSSITDMELL